MNVINIGERAVMFPTIIGVNGEGLDARPYHPTQYSQYCNYIVLSVELDSA